MEANKQIQTPGGDIHFQLRLLKEDGIGLLTAENGKSYLILDSLDYWYDVIQDGYPKLTKCTCKNSWFTVGFQYFYRDRSPDIREVQVHATCTACGRSSKRMTVDIDYSPTERLIEQPIIYCEKPNLKYRFSRFSALWDKQDLAKFLSFLMDELNLGAYYWFFKRPEHKRVFEQQTFEAALDKGDKFLLGYFSVKPIGNITTGEDDKGIWIDQELWRKQEVIVLSGVNFNGLPMYFIQFCGQYIDKGKIIDKSVSFDEITGRLTKWLRGNFATGRGKNCFDGEALYQKYTQLRHEGKM